MKELRDDYSLFKYIVYGILTLGIYDIWMFHSMVKDVNAICVLDKDKTPGVWKLILFSLLTCGIYSWFWWLGISRRLKRAVGKHNLHSEVTPGTVALTIFIGNYFPVCSWIGVKLVIDAVNELASDYNANPKAYTEPEPVPEQKKSYGYKNGWGD